MWPLICVCDLNTLTSPFECSPSCSSAPAPRGFVYFDAGSVIFDLDFDSYKRRLASLTPQGRTFAFKEFSSRMQQNQTMRRFAQGEIGPARFAHEVLLALGYSTNDIAEGNTPGIPAIKEVVNSMVGAARPRVLRLVKALRNRNFGVGVLSNAMPWHEADLEKKAPLSELFDIVIFSQDVGCEKPDPTIFHIAHREASRWAQKRFGRDLSAENIYFADDTPENVRAAQDLGWQARLVPLLTDEILFQAKSGTIPEAELGAHCGDTQNILFGDKIACRVEGLFSQLLQD